MIHAREADQADDSPSIQERIENHAEQELERRHKEIRQLVERADLGELARNLIEWLARRAVNAPNLGGDVLPRVHREDLQRRLTDILTVGFAGRRNKDQDDGYSALLGAVGLVPGVDTRVSEEGVTHCPTLFGLELDSNVGRLDAIRKALALLAGPGPRFQSEKELIAEVGEWATAKQLQKACGVLPSWLTRYHDGVAEGYKKLSRRDIVDRSTKKVQQQYNTRRLFHELKPHLDSKQ